MILNLATFKNLPNHQIRKLDKVFCYTVVGSRVSYAALLLYNQGQGKHNKDGEAMGVLTVLPIHRWYQIHAAKNLNHLCIGHLGTCGLLLRINVKLSSSFRWYFKIE